MPSDARTDLIGHILHEQERLERVDHHSANPHGELQAIQGNSQLTVMPTSVRLKYNSYIFSNERTFFADFCQIALREKGQIRLQRARCNTLSHRLIPPNSKSHLR